MSRYFFDNRHFQRWLFLLGGIAFILALLKNVFLQQHPGIAYYMVEVLAFIFFLTAFYISDRNNQGLRSEIKRLGEELKDTRSIHEQKIVELESVIAGYEAKQNEETRFASYQDKVIQRLVNDPVAKTDKHHLLYLFSELFHAMAVVWYEKDKPSGRFNVQATFGLPEDFELSPFEEGEGLHGQAAADGEATKIEDIPEEYLPVSTALGKSKQYFLYLLPVVKGQKCTGLIELMTFRESDVERLWPGVMTKLVDKNII